MPASAALDRYPQGNVGAQTIDEQRSQREPDAFFSSSAFARAPKLRLPQAVLLPMPSYSAEPVRDPRCPDLPPHRGGPLIRERPGRKPRARQPVFNRR